MSDNCKDCKLEHPKCPVCRKPDICSQKKITRCEKHIMIYICGNEKECKTCNDLGIEFFSGSGSTILRYKGEDYDPYGENMVRPLIKNFIQ